MSSFLPVRDHADNPDPLFSPGCFIHKAAPIQIWAGYRSGVKHSASVCKPQESFNHNESENQSRT